MTIEGIPDGWEFVRVGKPAVGVDWVVNRDGTAVLCEVEHHAHNWPIIRKIEKPKQYRPFANGAEFLAHPLSGDFIDVGAGEFAKVEHCNDDGIWIGSEEIDYVDAYHAYQFRDKSPFGVEVQ